MKNLLLFTVLSLIFISCEKELPPYVDVPEEEVDSTLWSDDYTNGGTLPNGSGGSVNELIGTEWVLTKVVSSFASEYPNDTIKFVDNTHYTLNDGAVRNYQLSNITGSTNKDLSLYFFAPFGGSHYSGQLGMYFSEDGKINNVEFEDINNSTTTIKAWFIKIN